MTRRIVLLLCFACALTSLSAQVCTPVFKKTFAGSGKDEPLFLLSTPDRGALIAGRTTSLSQGGQDALLMKVTEGGTIEWARSYGGSDSDQLVRVRRTGDGGYMGLGVSASFNNGRATPFLLKVSSDGTMQWAVRIQGTTALSESPGDLAVLQDGTLALVINRGKGTPQGDGLVARLSATGAVIWARAFDRGAEDGFNTIIEEDDSLVVGGYSDAGLKESILMKLNKANGDTYWTQRYSYGAGFDNQVVRIEKIAGGLAIASFALRYNTNPNWSTAYLAHFKRSHDGSFTYSTRSYLSTTSGSTVIDATSVLGGDGGFAFLSNGESNNSGSFMIKLNPLGWPLWHLPTASAYYPFSRTTGLDTAANNGYWTVGYEQSFWPTYQRTIKLVKLDRTGYAGSCMPIGSGAWTDTAVYSISFMNWNSAASTSLQVVGLPLVTGAPDIQQTSTCDSVSCTLPPISVPGCKSSFLSFVKGPTRLELYDVLSTSDGGTIGIGSQLFRSSFIMKLAADGNVAWAKTYGGQLDYLMPKRILPAGNGHYLVIGNLHHTYNNSAYVSPVLMKIDENGNQIWVRDYGQGLEVFDAISTPDGGYIMPFTGNYGGGMTYSFIIRVDAAGDPVWRREILHNAGAPVYKHLYLDGNSLYVLADYYIPSNTFRLEKWDASNGTISWRKRFLKDSGAISATMLTKVGDTVYAVLQNNVSPSWNTLRVHTIVCKFDTTGNLVSNYRFQQPNHSANAIAQTFNQHTYFSCYRTDDDQLVMAQQVQTATGAQLNITKFSPAGNVHWSRSYPNLQSHYVTGINGAGNGLLIGGRIVLSGTYSLNQFSSFILKTDAFGRISETATGYCQSDSVGVVIDTDMGIAPHWDDFTALVNDTTIRRRTRDLPAYEIDVESAMQCSVPSNCSTVSLQGPATICTLDSTYTYTLLRNPGCETPATWRVDTAGARIISFTDTSISVRFRRAGGVGLVGTLSTGCALLTTTRAVRVFQSANTLSLGADTLICPGNMIRLRAQPGFAAYQWQDGSSDSVFQVTAPGIYYVQVTDSCGAQYADTLSVAPHPPIAFDAGPDRVKCNNDTVHLQAPSGFFNYLWTPVSGSQSVSGPRLVVNPQVDNVYVLRAELSPGCFAYDTVRVQVFHSPVINLGRDTSFCSGSSLMLDAGSGFSQYSWSTGATSSSIMVNTTGNFGVVATTAEGCRSADTLRVMNLWSLPVPNLDPNPELCTGATRTLDPGAFVQYRWQDGSINSTYPVNGLGLFTVQVTDGRGCVARDSVRITTILPLPANFLPTDTAICSYGSLSLRSLQAFSGYTWSTGAATPTLTLTQPGTYWLQVRDAKGCIGRDTVVVRPKDCLKGLYVPSAFTPNGDGRNDRFRAEVFGKVIQFHLVVYNRWGQVVFESVDPARSWDGTLSGAQQNTGLFVWTCRYQLEGDQEKKEKGTLTLIR